MSNDKLAQEALDQIMEDVRWIANLGGSPSRCNHRNHAAASVLTEQGAAMNDLIQALEELLDALPSAAPDGAEMMAVAQRLKSAKDGARQALSRYRSSVEGVELPEAEIACAVDEFDLIQDWSKSHLAPGVHYLYTAATVRTLIAQAVERERESLLQRLD